MDQTLPGGDDFDWSIRLRDAGYKVLVDRDVFIYHHGFKSGTRLMGDHQTAGGWNSYEMQEKTDLALIKKHGLKKWWETKKGAWQIPTGHVGTWEDREGNLIRRLVAKSDKVVLDLGCGNNKTLKRATGVDYIPKGHQIPALTGAPVSDADILADVSKPLPFDDGSADVIIARHILEHVIDPIMVISQWAAKLKPGGKLIIAVPNQDWALTIPMNIEHLHAYTPSSLVGLLRAMGFKDVQVHDPKNKVSFVCSAIK